MTEKLLAESSTLSNKSGCKFSGLSLQIFLYHIYSWLAWTSFASITLSIYSWFPDLHFQSGPLLWTPDWHIQISARHTCVSPDILYLMCPNLNNQFALTFQTASSHSVSIIVNCTTPHPVGHDKNLEAMLDCFPHPMH